MSPVLILLVACSSPKPTEKVEAAPVAAVTAPTDEAEPEPEAPAEAPKRNKPPVVREATLETRAPREADDIVAKVEATDPENNNVQETYTWLLNGEEVLGFHDNRLTAGPYKRGDVVSARVALSDGELTTIAELGSVTIVNTNPTIDNPPSRIDHLDGMQLSARDEDGDSITWKMEGAPDGLTIDPAGKVHYKPSMTAAGGKYTVKITADDGNGGWARVDLPLAIKAGSDAGKEPPKPASGG